MRALAVIKGYQPTGFVMGITATMEVNVIQPVAVSVQRDHLVCAHLCYHNAYVGLVSAENFALTEWIATIIGTYRLNVVPTKGGLSWCGFWFVAVFLLGSWASISVLDGPHVKSMSLWRTVEMSLSFKASILVHRPMRLHPEK